MEAEDIALFPLLAIAGVATLVICAPFIAKGRSKKKIAVGVFIFTIIVGPLPVALRLVDVYYGTNIIPGNGSDIFGTFWLYIRRRWLL
ncbi:MAG: hypothetical protein Ct9H300mP3_00100 [Gammaproteobacteria bacterium]|nr:MAG: hypothetical protein Ct9H300mP3_00100 [Gammaproteobacteria bacterium]